MNLLENYLDANDNNEISSDIYTKYKEFGYKDEDMYIIDLEFLLDTIYCIKIIQIESKLEISKKRMGQIEFRKHILERFNNKCIVTDNDCIDELETCHIIPVATEEDYSIENGLLLARNIHSTFDKYLWSINPDTFMIESINIESKNIGTIKNYNNKQLLLHEDMRDNIRHHYNKYINININKP